MGYRISRIVGRQLSCWRCESTRVYYHRKCKVYGSWCGNEGHSSFRPSISKLANFIFLQRVKGLPVSTIKDYQSMLNGVFEAVLLEISLFSRLHDLIRFY